MEREIVSFLAYVTHVCAQVLSELVTASFFYGQRQTGIEQYITVGIISGLIMGIPAITFSIIFKKSLPRYTPVEAMILARLSKERHTGVDNDALVEILVAMRKKKGYVAIIPSREALSIF